MIKVGPGSVGYSVGAHRLGTVYPEVVCAAHPTCMHAAHNDAPQPKPRFNGAAWDAMPHGVAAQRPPARRHAARLVLCRPAHADAVRSCSVSQVSDEGGGIKREQVGAPRRGFAVLCCAVLQHSMRCHTSHFFARCPKPRGVIAWEAQRLPLCPRLTCSLQWPQSRPSREPCVRTAASRVPLATISALLALNGVTWLVPGEATALAVQYAQWAHPSGAQVDRIFSYLYTTAREGDTHDFGSDDLHDFGTQTPLAGQRRCGCELVLQARVARCTFYSARCVFSTAAQCRSAPSARARPTPLVATAQGWATACRWRGYTRGISTATWS